MAIAEIQRLKEKYPKYGPVPDHIILDQLRKKFPNHPGLQSVSDREFGTLKAGPETVRTRFHQEVLPRLEKTKKVFAEKATKLVAQPIGFLTGEEPPSDSTQLGAWIKQPIQSEFKPGKLEAPPVDIRTGKPVSPFGIREFDKEPRWVVASKRAGSVVYLSNMVRDAWRYINSDPLTKIRLDKFRPSVRFTKAQGRELTAFRAQLGAVLKKAGVDPVNAEKAVRSTVSKNFRRPGLRGKVGRTPVGIRESTNYLRAHGDEVADDFRGAFEGVKTEAEMNEFVSQWVRKATTSAPRIVGKAPLQLQDTAVRLPSRRVPVSSIIKDTAKAPPKIAPAPVAIDQSALTPTQVEPPKTMTQVHSVTYLSKGRQKVTAMTTDQMIKAKQEGKDIWGQPIDRWIDNFPMKETDSFHAGIPIPKLVKDWDQLFPGLGETMNKGFVKSISMPFWVAEKYPEFKQIFDPINNITYSSTEKFHAGWKLMNEEGHKLLPQASKDAVGKALWTGDKPEVQKYYSPDELKKFFGMNDKEIESYVGVVNAMNYATALEKETRRITYGYYEANLPKVDKDKLDALINSQVEKLGGYMRHGRFGDWAVVVPPDKLGEEVKFFALVPSGHKLAPRALADKLASELRNEGEKPLVYKKQFIPEKFIGGLSLVDLENLFDAIGMESSPAVEGGLDLAYDAIRKHKLTKGFGRFFVKRQNIPGYLQTFDNAVDSTYEYLLGTVHRHAKVVGRRGAEAGYRQLKGTSNKQLQAFARQYIDNYFAYGRANYPSIQKFVYAYYLGGKLSFFVQNMTQSILTTYPEMSKYYKGIDTEKKFLQAAKQSIDYLMYRKGGVGKEGDADLFNKLDNLARKGILGGVQTRYMLGESMIRRKSPTKLGGKVKRTLWEAIEAFGKWSEEALRTHAAVAGHGIARDVLKLPDAGVEEFMTNMVNKTQFAYGKHNIPQVISGAGSAKPAFRLLFTFRSFAANYLHWLSQTFHHPSNGAKIRALLALIGVGGVGAVPFTALVNEVLKRTTGQTIEGLAREKLKNVPAPIVDVVLKGAPALIGADMSRLVGLGDIMPRSTDITDVAGAVGGLWSRAKMATEFALSGEPRRAIEKASPSAIENVLRAEREARDGVRKKSGQLIIPAGNLTTWDTALRAAGIPPLSVSKVYGSMEAQAAMKGHILRRTAHFNRLIALAHYKRDPVEAARLHKQIRAMNKALPSEQRIRVSAKSIKAWIAKFKGKRRVSPKRLRRRFKEIERVFNR
ncbi:hypothetical protein LCGC14_1088170 [marine sediment metagenome]|uniref:Large polyvalent protein associated domain-containing protein n=1 Tax=marine sediment metagenome TaxID=412755 RepID=A0A0F9QJ87_9ZZZZ